MYTGVLMLADDLLSGLGSVVIVFAAFKAVYLLSKGILADSLDMNIVRLEFGKGILLGLEFMIGADIIGSIAKPTYYDIGMLAALVVIRTFLSYFLGKELEALKANREKA